ncbi:MAG: polyhydroxyalkanoic acid system family protein [Planctomycetes bacterium]|nr:polyhydroxyalkanoic acid system family protein [Planctomycetota bacterium]MBI3845458.1 polyhydroxyalkanoic acid system family protein [Planctomycetota bacterium]
MADIDITVPTDRTPDQLRAALDAELAARLPGGMIKRTWEGDTLRLEGMGADGRVRLESGKMVATVTLKPPISFMKGKVEEGLRQTMEKIAKA